MLTVSRTMALAAMGCSLCFTVNGAVSVTAVAAGGAHFLALASDGTVWAWGSNDFGQLGDGTYVTRQVTSSAGW